MDMDMSGGDSSSLMPLNDSGVDFSNFSQAFDFQQEILDDTILQVIANSYARSFWYGIVVVIGIATMFNISQQCIFRLRIRAAAANKSRPASAQNFFTRFVGTVTAILREATYPQFSPARTNLWLKVPPLGIIMLLLTYLGFLLALQFLDNDIPGAQHYTALGVRAAWLAVAQIPLLLLLAGKANLIGALVGVSYERLNVLHRWVARGTLILVTLHFGYQSFGWNQYGLMQLEWDTDTCPPTGMAAYALLLWLNLSTLAPIRNRFYEVFVVQHILSFIAFVYLVMAHIPSTALYARVYVYAGIGIYFLDRLIRALRYAYHNRRFSRATLTAFDGDVTKVRVRNTQIKSWSPGSHVFLSIPHLGFGQSHPATIASTPSSHDGDLIFILKSKKGFTKRLLQMGTSSQLSLQDSTKTPAQDLKKDLEKDMAADKTYIALVGGPYGSSHSNPIAFDTVLLVAGSTGVTFTLSILQSLADQCQTTPGKLLPFRMVEFIWVVKQASWTSWVANELATAVTQLESQGIKVKVTIYVTCDDSLTEFTPTSASSQCRCNPSSLGPCCCDIDVTVKNEEKATLPSADDITKANGQTFDIAPTGQPKSVASIATFKSGRPDMADLVWELAGQAEGEMGIYACGPLGLSTCIRNAVVRVSDERAVHKGSGAEGIYLHIESFAW